ncbi:uncharacterized protein LOC143224793 [Tachypleus tridentatus]|uniref:uncharacterized protein LOC143224793 n=1 Tax=Tachypleus tridentatus TaxID=6853 RepID=UPI003FD169AF
MNNPPEISASSLSVQDNVDNDTSEVLRWLMLNRNEIGQVSEGRGSTLGPPRLLQGIRARQRLRSLALTSAATISTRREYVGTDVFIVIGLGVGFIGTAIALVGLLVPFGNTEVRPLILGIGLAITAFGLIIAGVRILSCRFYRTDLCCRCFNKIMNFPRQKKALVHPTPAHIICPSTSSTSSSNNISFDHSSFTKSHSSKTLDAMLKSSFRSTTKPTTANRVNFDSSIETFSVKSGTQSLVWYSQSSGPLRKFEAKQNPSSYLELKGPSTVETVEINSDLYSSFRQKARWSELKIPFQRHYLTASTEKRLSDGLDKTRTNSANFHEDFNKTIQELKMK